MIISFETTSFDGKRDIFNVKKDERSVLMFPMEGVDVESIYGSTAPAHYRIYFDTEVELDESHTITPMIKKVGKLYLRGKKINKIIENI